MLLTVTATASDALPDATDLGYLLHKHPAKAQAFGIAAGTAHVVYPEATPHRCTAALLVEIDPVGLVRGGDPRQRRGRGDGRGRSDDGTLAQYVNDRPYAAGSLLAVALGSVFRTALAGRCDARPDAAAAPLPLEVVVPVLPSRGGPDLAHRLFAPLGWDVEAGPIPLDPAFADWGESRYVRLRLRGALRLADALNHLYVLLPVLDDAKHYWVAADEVDKLVRAGSGWLATHPERGLITRRYLRRKHTFVRTALEALALERLADTDDTGVEVLDNAVPDDTALDNAVPDDALGGEVPSSLRDQGKMRAQDSLITAGEGENAAFPSPGTTRRVSLARLRIEAVLGVLRSAGARTVVDLGCGEGALLAELLTDPAFTRIVGADVSFKALQAARRRLRLDRRPDRVADRLELVQTALTYRDPRLAGFDAAVLAEVVEHLDPPRLPALEAGVFEAARPRLVVVTTPNVEYNPRYGLAPGNLRHPDHRFEWTREQFRAWADGVAARTGYAVTYAGAGEPDPDLGHPTQLAVFTR